MFKFRFALPMGIALLANGSLLAHAASDLECAQYAETTVEQHAENLKQGCGFSGLRWHDNKLGHFVFCKAADTNTINAEIQLRASMLEQCSPAVEAEPEPHVVVQPEQAPDLDDSPVEEAEDEPMELELNDLPADDMPADDVLDDEEFIDEG
ncbi:MAG: hypothetical protein NXI27_23065 [Alphaproteobacteria bacterium]|nr:hypothetical protein [Alphaproteobacteria bacterium]